MTEPEQHMRLPLPFSAVVTGDTHVRQGRPELPAELSDALERSDLIFHTGDFCDRKTRARFENHGVVLAVSGNNEEVDLLETLPVRLRATAGERTILLTHGHLERGPSARVAVENAYAGWEDLVIFGHSHTPGWKEVKGTCFLNPGSPTMRRREPQFSFAMLEIDASNRANAYFVRFDR